MADLINGMSGRERGGGSGMFKQGDAVMVGPFDIVQFRDTNRPGPQDDGNTAILSRHESVGAMSADLALLIPHSDAMSAVARWIWEHGEEDFRHLIELAVYHLPDSEHGPYVGDAAYLRHLEKAGSELIATLTGGEGAGG